MKKMFKLYTNDKQAGALLQIGQTGAPPVGNRPGADPLVGSRNIHGYSEQRIGLADLEHLLQQL